jgi:hypothetical protein
MKKHFSPTRLLQITRVDAFTQKRQLNSPSDDNTKLTSCALFHECTQHDAPTHVNNGQES